MSETAITKTEPEFPKAIEQALIGGDLSKLSVEERLTYYNSVCKSLNFNPLTRPFEYITLNNRLVLYATKNATEQARNNHNVSITITAREERNGCWIVTAQAKLPSGRTDESIGAVNVTNLKGDHLANAIMKAETKAKRRVTLSICGLGVLDESELETIPGASHAVDTTHQDLHHTDKATGYAGEPGNREPAITGRPKAQSPAPTNVGEQLENLNHLLTLITTHKITEDSQKKWCDKYGAADVNHLSDAAIAKIIDAIEKKYPAKAAA